ncbi:hypothetical protein N7456_013269 [Penicillium angulare]|uniref:Ubiquitin-like domain-containing protein n=1 Tax=Penicillium angulare TaxID=116970 RepID=A0A9W9EL71_9EURO|nr:hypothetical protein N7456_013269 [Penicillium angulare]
MPRTRTFFNKPSWAVKTGVANDEFYRRSQNTYADIIAANREENKKSKSSSTIVDRIEKHERPCKKENTRPKRARLSNESNHSESTTPARSSSKQQSPSEYQPAPSTSQDIPKEPEPSHSPAAGEDLKTPPLSAAALQLKPNTPDNTTPANLPAASSPTCPTTREKNDSELITENKLQSAALPLPSQTAESSSATPKDPIVQILITSEIKSTKPLLVNRKMSQGLREVRLEWCKRQGFSDETKSSIYLTWQGRRLFDVTTCRSLGIKRKSTWEMFGMDDDLAAEQEELRIHMVAVTNDPLLLAGPSSSAADNPTPTSQSPSSRDTAENAPMKLVLRSPGFNDLRIKARPTTVVSKLIAAFRDKQNIPEKHDVRLFFDGDQLDPTSCLNDNDIADLDLVDVQIKPQA